MIYYPEHLPFRETVMKSDNYNNIMKVWLEVFFFKLNNNKTINYTSLNSHLFSSLKEQYIFGEMFHIRSNWQKFPTKLSGPNVNMFLQKGMNVIEDCTIMKSESDFNWITNYV